MGFWSSILGDIGIGNGSADETGNTYSFSQQQKDFIKLQFKYGYLLHQKLATGQISQEYYDSHIWLTQQSLQAPYAGWWSEFKTAIEQEDLQWLSRQVGETVEDLTKWIGQTAGQVIGGAIGGVTEGLATGLSTSLGFFGWIVVIGAGVGLYYAYKKGALKNLPYVGPLF